MIQTQISASLRNDSIVSATNLRLNWGPIANPQPTACLLAVSIATVITDPSSDEKLCTETGVSPSFAEALTRFQIAQREQDPAGVDVVQDYAIEPGTQIGDYQVIEKLGEGGMGVVLRARDVSLNRDVAIKIISPSVAWNEQMVERFNREARAMASIDHENVMPILTWGRHQGLPYFVMPYTKGQTLQQLRKEADKIPTPRLLSIARQTAEALSCIHEAGLIHRDLKPSNIWIESSTGHIKILDFGLVQAETVGKQLTQIGAFTGTPGYMAPEQVTGELTSPRTDVFSFGATLYFAICGRPPFVAKTPNAAAIATASLPFELISKNRYSQPGALIDLVHACLHKEPDARPTTAKELLDRLQSVRTCPNGTSSLFKRRFSWLAGLAIAGTIAIVIVATQVVEPTRSMTLIAATSNDQPSQPSVKKHATSPPLDDAAIVASLPNWLTQKQHVALRNRLDAARLLLSFQRSDGSETARRAIEQQLSRSLDPSVRSDVIHLGPSYLTFRQALSFATKSTSPDIQAAALQLAAGFDDPAIHPNAAANNSTLNRIKQRLHDAAMSAVKQSLDAELQSTCRWLIARTSENGTTISDIVAPVASFDDSQFPMWMSSELGPDMIAFTKPELAILGSPLNERGRETTEEDRVEDRRTASLPSRFAIAVTETTVAQLNAILPEAVRESNGHEPEAAARQVSWGEVAEYCNRLTELAGMGPDEYCYETYQKDGMWFADTTNDSLNRAGYRLPTDDEWEFACRGGSRTSRFFGDDCTWLTQYASVGPVDDDQSGAVSTVARHKPNPFGLFDMLGNISEWTDDHVWISKIRHRRIRGGSVFTEFDGIRSAARYNINERMWPPHRRIGFRIARTLPSENN